MAETYVGKRIKRTEDPRVDQRISALRRRHSTAGHSARRFSQIDLRARAITNIDTAEALKVPGVVRLHRQRHRRKG